MPSKDYGTFILQCQVNKSFLSHGFIGVYVMYECMYVWVIVYLECI